MGTDLGWGTRRETRRAGAGEWVGRSVVTVRVRELCDRRWRCHMRANKRVAGTQRKRRGSAETGAMRRWGREGTNPAAKQNLEKLRASGNTHMREKDPMDHVRETRRIPEQTLQT